MDIEFDTAKDAANMDKHGISLAVALLIFETMVADIRDDRRDDGEERFNAFGFVGGRLYACSYTLHGTRYRIISVRKANRQEQRRWQS